MGYKSQVPSHGAAQPIAPPAPPDDPDPNMAMLKGDIDSGRTGDKVPVFDPGMAMLGTCEEAAGTPLTPEQIRLARQEENKRRWRFGTRGASAAQNKERPGRAVRLLRPDRRDRRGDCGLPLADVINPQAAASIAAGAWTAPWRRLAMMPMICCGK
jgi:hypothetical protein